jgi:hypothetical protein
MWAFILFAIGCFIINRMVMHPRSRRRYPPDTWRGLPHDRAAKHDGRRFTRRDAPPSKKPAGEITDAQVATLLRITDNRLTARRLASATGVTDKQAKTFLDNQVLSDKLTVEAGDTELIYKR